jgi:AhpC/TSA family
MLIVAALTLTTGLILLDLVLTLAIIRRLRQHTVRLGELDSILRPSPGLEPGSPLPEFTAATGGESISTASLMGSTTIVIFLSADCNGWHEQLPAIQAYLRAGAHHAIAVVGGDDPELAGAFDGLAKVIVEDLQGPVQRAFRVRTYPSFVVAGPDGKVEAAALTVQELPANTPALP